MSLFALIGSASAAATPPANPPAWNATTPYDRAGLYVSHKDKIWVSQWSIILGAEPGANDWNGWKKGAALSKDAARPQPPGMWTVSMTAQVMRPWPVRDRLRLRGCNNNDAMYSLSVDHID